MKPPDQAAGAPAATVPLTVIVRGRPVAIDRAALQIALESDGPFRSLAHLEAVVRSPEHGYPRAPAIDRLRRAVAAGEIGVYTLQAVYGLLRLEGKEGAPELRALAGRLGGSLGAIALAAAFLVEDRALELAGAAETDPLLARSSPQPFLHLPHVPRGAPALFAAWVAELRRSSTGLGSTAFRAFLGDVAEAAFRALQHGADPIALLGPGAAFLSDAICAELGGTTDFLAARGMAWLLGALAPGDDTARAAIERARDRFRDSEFQSDCAAILAGHAWPPRDV